MTVDIDQFRKDFKKMFKEDIVIDPKQIVDKEKMIIPVGPSLDLGLSGGIPEGSVVTSSGKPKTGKTYTALCFAANAQKPEYGGRHVFFGNVEGRLKKMNLTGVKGLDLDKFTIIGSTRNKILTAQDYLTAFLHIIKTYPKCVLIIDSESALCGADEMDTGIGYENRGSVNKAFSSFIRQAANDVPIQDSVLWCIRHLAQSQSKFGATWNEKGAMATQYQADVQLRIQFDKPWKVGSGEKEKQIGQEVHWLVETSALGRPNVEVVSYLRYGSGIDGVFELVNLGAELGLITQAGAWMTAEFMKRHLDVLGLKEMNEKEEKKLKAQGMDKMLGLFNENPSWIPVLQKEVRGLIS